MRVGDPHHHVLRRRIDQPLDEVEAHALDAGAVQLLELVVGDLLADERHALGLAVRASPAHRPARGCRCRGRSPARSRSCRSRGNRAARTASPSARRTACTCAWARTETSPPARTRGNAHRPRPPAACISASTDWDGTECSRHSSAREFSIRCHAREAGISNHRIVSSVYWIVRFADDDSDLHPLDRQRHALPDADAHGGERALAALLRPSDAPR